MNVVLTVGEIVAPVFCLAAVGFTWVRLGFEYRVRFVTQLAMTLATPCLIFTGLMQAEIDPGALTAIGLAALVGYTSLTLIFWGLVTFAGLPRRTFLAPLIFGNTGNLGLPLALLAFGDSGLALAIVVFAVTAIGSFTFGVWLVSGGGNPARVLKEPVAIAAVLGGLFLWHGWQTPAVITNTLSLIGQLSIPLMLITLGVAISRLRPTRFSRSLWLSLAKAAVSVAVGWAIGRWFGLDPTAFAILVLQLATPVAVTSYLIAEMYEADSDDVAGLVVVSTLLSIVVLPVLLALLI